MKVIIRQITALSSTITRSPHTPGARDPISAISMTKMVTTGFHYYHSFTNRTIALTLLSPNTMHKTCQHVSYPLTH